MTKNTSNQWLNPSDYVDMAPESPGTVNIFHCKQGPGNDRLYITRKEDGNIVAYCHHCGSRGAHRVAGQRAFSRREQNKLLEESRNNLETGLGIVSEILIKNNLAEGIRTPAGSIIIPPDCPDAIRQELLKLGETMQKDGGSNTDSP